MAVGLPATSYGWSTSHLASESERVIADRWTATNFDTQPGVEVGAGSVAVGQPTCGHLALSVPLLILLA
jgi:hypothetical protein